MSISLTLLFQTKFMCSALLLFLSNLFHPGLFVWTIGASHIPMILRCLWRCAALTHKHPFFVFMVWQKEAVHEWQAYG